jgi:hypothetical protein
MEAAYGVMIFTTIATFIVAAYNIATTLALHKLYNHWAVLALDIFLIIFWLISFALLGSVSSSFIIVSYSYSYFFKRDLTKRAEPGYIPWETGAAAAGLGGVELYVPVLLIQTARLRAVATMS